MTLRRTMTMPVFLALLAPLRAEKPEFDWTTLHQRVAELLQHASIAEAEKVLEESIEAARRQKETNADLATALNGLGSLYHDSGRFVEAERAYVESLSIWRRVDAANPKRAIALGNLAALRLAQGRPSDAEKLYLEAEGLAISAYGMNSVEAARVFSGLAETYWEMGRYEKAKLLGDRAVSILESQASSPHLGVALSILSITALKQNHDQEAERLLRRAIEVFRRTLGRQHPTVGAGLVSLAALMSRRKPSEAGQLFSEGLQLVETRLGPNHLFTGCSLMAYARHLEDHGQKGEAERLKRRGEQILARHSRENRLGHTLDIKAFQRPNASAKRDHSNQ